jgi:radical SAM protein with 4Fe4S-binding SPASM domain
VPTGRGKGLAQEELSSQDYEYTLKWIYHKQIELGERMQFKPTDAPHYMRIAHQCGVSAIGGHPGVPAPPGGPGHHGLHSLTRGCLAGVGFCFVSHTGKVQGCGYLDIEAGDIRRQTFGDVWMNSPFFYRLRNLANLKGKCGVCEFRRVCGGCRARAYEVTGDYLAAEPYCVYQPLSNNTVKQLSGVTSDENLA